MSDFSLVPHYQILKISGDDASSFLQGQLTTDISQLKNGWQLSGYCSPKGRLLAVLYLFEYESNIFMLVENSIADSVIKRLQMYVLRSKVAIEVMEQAKSIATWNGESELGSLAQLDGLPCLGFGPCSLIIDLSGQWRNEQKLEPASEQWTNALVKAGIPTITANTQELFVPQMVNLDLLNGINFKKGCYTGQEIVARMHYLGKLKQRMFVCKYNGEHTATGGDKVVTAGGKNAGNLVSVGSNQHALAVLRLEDKASELQMESGGQLHVEADQPYPIPETQDP